MRGEATLVFDEPFEISENGSFVRVNTVTVRAPGLGKAHVHATMQAYVMEAVMGMQRKRPELMQQSKAERSPLDPVGGPIEEPKDAIESAEDEYALVLQLMSSGLGVERWPAFFDYVYTQLTLSKLASAGESGTQLTKETWDSIEQTNGMEAVERIIGAFGSFFTKSMLQRKTGSGPSPTSSSHRTAATRQSTRASSRSRS